MKDNHGYGSAMNDDSALPDGAALRRAFGDLMKPRPFEPNTMPAMGASWWRTVPDDMLRQILSSGMTLMLGTSSWEVIRRRASELGITLDLGSEVDGRRGAAAARNANGKIGADE